MFNMLLKYLQTPSKDKHWFIGVMGVVFFTMWFYFLVFQKCFHFWFCRHFPFFVFSVAYFSFLVLHFLFYMGYVGRCLILRARDSWSLNLFFLSFFIPSRKLIYTILPFYIDTWIFVQETEIAFHTASVHVTITTTLLFLVLAVIVIIFSFMVVMTILCFVKYCVNINAH